MPTAALLFRKGMFKKKTVNLKEKKEKQNCAKFNNTGLILLIGKIFIFRQILLSLSSGNNFSHGLLLVQLLKNKKKKKKLRIIFGEINETNFKVPLFVHNHPKFFCKVLKQQNVDMNHVALTCKFDFVRHQKYFLLDEPLHY